MLSAPTVAPRVLEEAPGPRRQIGLRAATPRQASRKPSKANTERPQIVTKRCGNAKRVILQRSTTRAFRRRNLFLELSITWRLAWQPWPDGRPLAPRRQPSHQSSSRRKPDHPPDPQRNNPARTLRTAGQASDNPRTNDRPDSAGTNPYSRSSWDCQWAYSRSHPAFLCLMTSSFPDWRGSKLYGIISLKHTGNPYSCSLI